MSAVAAPTGRPLRVVWLAPYPVQSLVPRLRLARSPRHQHACSWIVNLSAALARRGDVELHLVTESGLVAADQHVAQDGITVHVVKVGVPVLDRGFPGWLPLDLLTGFRWNAHRLLRVVQALQPALVHAHGTEAAYALAGLAARRPCLVSIQGIITEYQKTNPSFRFRVVQHLEQAQVRQARYFTCRTAFDTAFVRSVNPTARIFQIPEAMHPVYFGPAWTPPAEPGLLFVGSTAPRKGLETLLLALPQVVARYPAVRLRVIGGGETDAVRQRCRALGIEAQVEWRGFQTAAAIAACHRQSRLFVLPSENENSPNALAEAMISGLPVIATAVGGIPSMIEDGQTGRLVPPRDPARLAAAILELLAQPAELVRLGANARRVAEERHRPESVAAATVAAYRTILAETAGTT